MHKKFFKETLPLLTLLTATIQHQQKLKIQLPPTSPPVFNILTMGYIFDVFIIRTTYCQSLKSPQSIIPNTYILKKKSLSQKLVLIFLPILLYRNLQSLYKPNRWTNEYLSVKSCHKKLSKNCTFSILWCQLFYKV